MPDDLNHSPEHALPAPPEEHLLPAPVAGRPRTSPPQDGDSLAMRMLYDEQARLRAELDALRQKDEEGSGGKKGGGKEGGDGGGGDDAGGDSSGGDDESSGDGKKKKKVDIKDKRMKRARYTFLGVLILIPLLLVTAWLLWYLSGYESTDDAFVDGHTGPDRDAHQRNGCERLRGEHVPREEGAAAGAVGPARQ